MPLFLVTGPTGNVGTEVIRALYNAPHPPEVVAAVRQPSDVPARWATEFPALRTVPFDFGDPATFGPALAGVDALFLLRPPQIADTKPFEALLAHVPPGTHVVFLSVQGVQRSRVIPHNQIERLIVASGLPYTFLRPGYFMQNLTTTLASDLRRRRIVLPAGHAVFNWVDARDIGAVAAHVLRNAPKFENQAFDVTGDENLDFGTVARCLSEQLGETFAYESPNLLRFFWQKRRQGLSPVYIGVLIALHYLPRFQAPPTRSDIVRTLLGRPPHTLADFIARERAPLLAR